MNLIECCSKSIMLASEILWICDSETGNYECFLEAGDNSVRKFYRVYYCPFCGKKLEVENDENFINMSQDYYYEKNWITERHYGFH